MVSVCSTMRRGSTRNMYTCGWVALQTDRSRQSLGEFVYGNIAAGKNNSKPVLL
jgi:hypothetical protein